MAQVDIPMALGAAFWEKQKGALAKAAKAPPTKLADELKALAKLHLGVKWEGSDFSADDVKTLLAQLQTVVTALDKFEAKKDKAFPKEPLTAVAAIDKAAKEYRSAVDSYVTARKTAAAKAASTTASKPKPAATAGGGASAKAFKLVRAKLLGAIALLRKPAQPGTVRRPMRFIVVQGKAGVTLMLGVAVGPSQVKMLTALSGADEGPFKTLKFPDSSVVWEKNALTFVSDRLSGSLLKKVQVWLKKTFKLNVKLRLRNSKGMVEETEGDDLSDDMLKMDGDDALSAEDAAQEYQERLAAMADAIRKAMAQPMGSKVKALMGSSAHSAKTGRYEGALGDLDEIEALLEEGGLGERAEGEEAEAEGEETAVASSSARPKGADSKQQELEKLMADWKARRAKVVDSLKSVAGKIAAAKHGSSTKAILEIQAVMKNITAEPATLQQVTELRKWLSTDDVVNDVCELAADVRTPLLVPLERMHALLKSA